MNGDGDRTGSVMNPWNILGWIFDALGACALAYCIWVAGEITELKEWRAETAGNRWNSQMQADFAAKQTVEFARMWQEMAAMKTDWLKSINEVNLKLAQLPGTLQVPPKWWEDYVRQNLQDHNDRLRVLEEKNSPVNRKGTEP